MTVHELKCMTPYFQHIWDGHKTFEVRHNDRDFQPGDVLRLREWTGQEYTGREASREVIYVMRDGVLFGVVDGYVVMALASDGIVPGS